MDKYIPPFDITEDMLDLVAEIMDSLATSTNWKDCQGSAK